MDPPTRGSEPADDVLGPAGHQGVRWSLDRIGGGVDLVRRLDHHDHWDRVGVGRAGVRPPEGGARLRRVLRDSARQDVQRWRPDCHGGLREDVIALGFTKIIITEMGQPPTVQGGGPGHLRPQRGIHGQLLQGTRLGYFPWNAFWLALPPSNDDHKIR